MLIIFFNILLDNDWCSSRWDTLYIIFNIIVLAVGLCPKMPLYSDGMRIDPAISEPIPITEAPAPSKAPLNNHTLYILINKTVIALYRVKIVTLRHAIWWFFSIKNGYLRLYHATKMGYKKYHFYCRKIKL